MTNRWRTSIGSAWAAISGAEHPVANGRNLWLVVLAATAPVIGLHLFYLQGHGVLWRIVQIVSALAGAAAGVLTAHRYLPWWGFAGWCGLLGATAMFLGGYANVFSDRPSLFSLAHTAGEGLQVLPAWLLFLPWTLIVIGPVGAALAIWLAPKARRARGHALVGMWAGWMLIQGIAWAMSREIQPFRTTQHRTVAGFWVSSAADAFMAYRSWDDSGLVRAVEEDAQRRPPRPIALKEGFSDKILVIQLESLDAKAIGLKHQDRLVLPFLTKLSEDCPYTLMDPNHFGPSGSSGAEFQLLTGFRPVAPKPSFSLNRMDWRRVGLPWALREKGFTALAFHGNEGTYWNRREPFLASGFHRFFEKKDILPVPDQRWGVSDRALFQAVSRELPRHSGPIFAFVITMTSHAPFDYAPILFSFENDMLSMYCNSINYLDKQLEHFFSVISKWEGWTVVMYGDHASMVKYKNYDCLFGGQERSPLWIFKISDGCFLNINNNELKSSNHAIELVDLYHTMKNIIR